MRAMSDMTMAWMELMQQWSASVQPASNGQAPVGHAGPFSAGRPVAAAEAASPTPVREPKKTEPQAGHRQLKVSVESSGRVEVSMRFDELSAAASLVASALMAFDGAAEPIRDVTLEPGAAGEPPLLRIVVPSGQPAGTYNGLLLERTTKHPCGSITLLVLS